MKEKLTIGLSLALLMLLLGCLEQPAPEENLSGFRDCGENQECFEQALENCEKAFASPKIQDEKGSLEVKAIVYGLEGEKCKTKFTIEDVKMKAEGEEQALANIIVSLLKGKEMACLLPEDQTIDMTQFNREQLEQYCSGSLMEALKSFDQAASQSQ